MDNDNKSSFLYFGKAVITYIIIIAFSACFTLFCHKEEYFGNLQTPLSFAVGIAGTFASMYSIWISAKSDKELADERKARKTFFKELNEKLGNIIQNTDSLKEDIEAVLNERTNDGMASCYDSNLVNKVDIIEKEHEEKDISEESNKDISDTVIDITIWNSQNESNEDVIK